MKQTTASQLSVRLSVLVACVVAVFLLIGGAADAEGPPLPTVEYVVVEGDTLWGIASGVTGPDEDVRNVISDIREASGLRTSVIHPGQILLIPER